MRLGIQAMRATVNFGLGDSDPAHNIRLVKLAEELGYDSVWTAEASGTDAVVPLAWLAAHTKTIKVGTAVMQMSARPPTTTAMTAATLDLLSGGRFMLGLGVSGPIVVEGWHGQVYGRPLAKTREYLHVVQAALARKPVDVDGEYYRMPYRLDDSTGLATPVRMMFRPRRKKIPIYLAAMGPKNVALAHDLVDGFMPAFYSPHREQVFFEHLPGKAPRQGFDVAPFVPIAVGPDIDVCRKRLKTGFAFWLGGMGTRGLNFYNQLVRRMGFEQAADEVQQLYGRGLRAQAAAAIPDALVDELALVGPRSHIADQLDAWKKSSATTMILNGPDERAIRTVAELVL
jgi:F420-dependent oxidoreductase-like protein